MTARLKLKPGANGTKKLLEQYGESLICVRYRYDEASCTRLKTVEILVEKKNWTPPPPKFSSDELVPVQIGYAEKTMQQMARDAGGRWDPDAKLWFLQYGKIKATALKKHIILDTKPNAKKQ